MAVDPVLVEDFHGLARWMDNGLFQASSDKTREPCASGLGASDECWDCIAHRMACRPCA